MKPPGDIFYGSKRNELDDFDYGELFDVEILDLQRYTQHHDGAWDFMTQ